MDKKPNRKTLIVKLVFGLALLLFISWKISNSLLNKEFDDLVFSDNSVGLIVLSFLMMPINWLIETVKWQLLLRRIKRQNFAKTILDILAGISTSLLTPNRIGNFIGRTLNLDKEYRTKALILTIHSNLAQFTASLFFGFIGLSLINFNPEYVSLVGLKFSALVVIAVGLALYFYPKLIDFNPLSKMYSLQAKQGIELIQKQSVSLKFLILLLSLFRYLVYLIQFYIILSCFDLDLDPAEIVPAIAVVYLITTIIPSFLFGKLFVREVSALFVLTAFGIPTPIILLTVFILWIINLAIPALLGGIVLMKSK